MRGKHVHEVGPGVGDRLIPACAGKTTRCWRTMIPAEAHPRACGENEYHHDLAVLGAGSSPRVRGKRGRACARVHVDGLIPARAGKTSAPRRRCRPRPAHPRACGENRGCT
ncbi:hypothetical protein HMPREF9005_1170 [Actinomyces sp. oral taxon 178 str. F0338]|nr:hypothetical protein HMPREF9005_1170 [Actinomyces sp. oral taxon 178 str. F0338]